MDEVGAADDSNLLALRAAVLAGVRDASVRKMTMRSVAVLLAVDGGQVTPTVKELAKHLRIPKPGVTRSLDLLESLKMLRRRVDPTDRRSVVVSMRTAGRAYIDRLAEAAREHGAQLPGAAV